jgi:signal transduction histidine kinase
MTDRLRVLYAEDNPHDADLTRSFFDRHAPDFEIEVAETGDACLARLSAASYDALLLDYRLPGKDGVDLLQEVAERELRLPVVMVTGVGDETLVVQLLRRGAADYVPKQGDYLEKLPALLRNTVKEYRSARQVHPSRPQRRRVLYVEPNEADIDLTVRHFAEWASHLTLEIARSSVDALAMLQRTPVDLVMSDLRLPGLNALEFLKELRLSGVQVPFLVITGRGDELAAVAALKLGAYDYIVKRDNYLMQLPYAVDNAIDRFELACANERLQSEIAERTKAEATLRDKTAALAESSRQKDEFLAMLGHELRNPLAPVRTALEILQRGDAHTGIARRAHAVMDRHIAHMVRMVDDLLDVARITGGQIRLHVEETDLREIVSQAIDSSRPLIEARRHQHDLSLPPDAVPVRGDVTRLVQVAVNLLNNAAKYTGEAGTIRVTVLREGAHAVLRVADTGVGISPRLLGRIFDLFAQDDRTLDRAQGGLGLGLSLVRRITELHGGHVDAHSEGRGLGSEFTVRLPLHVPLSAAAHVDRVAAPAAPRRPLRCLVVEDNRDAAQMLEVALGFEGHDVRLTFDGHSALEAARGFQPDAVVLDIGLPGMTGYDVARALRELPELGRVNIIAATGYGQDEDRARGREAGFDHYLVKPIALDALLDALTAGPSAD